MAPRLKFRGQPFREEDTAGALLKKALGDPAFSRATLVAAWVRFGGLSRLEPAVDSNGNPVEETTVPFDITIEGEPLGRKDLVVDHAVHRESGQANHMTVLHWGALMPALLATDYSNYTVTIERLSDDTYRLDISP